MNNKDKKLAETLKWLPGLIPLLSLLLGGGALWYTWLRYASLVGQPNTYWYHWIQPAFFGFTGILCLVAAILFILGKSSGWPVLEMGLAIIPLLLFFNLIVFLFRGIQNLIQGTAGFFFDRLLAQPYKLILIPVIVIILTLFEILNKRGKGSSNS